MKYGIAYSRKSSKTGRILKEALDATRRGLDRCDVVINWGTSDLWACDAPLVFNRDAESAINKFEMIKTLKNAGVPVPEYKTVGDNIQALADTQGCVYIRGFDNETRYAPVDSFDTDNDAYASRPVAMKRREYRLHVFDGQIFAMYEKVPKESFIGMPKLFKAETCDFRRVEPTISLCNLEGQSIAKRAVRALGLDYGAVDMIRTMGGASYVVCEVNSSSGLNTANVKRLVDLIRRKYERGGVL